MSQKELRRKFVKEKTKEVNDLLKDLTALARKNSSKKQEEKVEIFKPVFDKLYEITPELEKSFPREQAATMHTTPLGMVFAQAIEKQSLKEYPDNKVEDIDLDPFNDLIEEVKVSRQTGSTKRVRIRDSEGTELEETTEIPDFAEDTYYTFKAKSKEDLIESFRSILASTLAVSTAEAQTLIPEQGQEAVNIDYSDIDQRVKYQTAKALRQMALGELNAHDPSGEEPIITLSLKKVMKDAEVNNHFESLMTEFYNKFKEENGITIKMIDSESRQVIAEDGTTQTRIIKKPIPFLDESIASPLARSLFTEVTAKDQNGRERKKMLFELWQDELSKKLFESAKNFVSNADNHIIRNDKVNSKFYELFYDTVRDTNKEMDSRGVDAQWEMYKFDNPFAKVEAQNNLHLIDKMYDDQRGGQPQGHSSFSPNTSSILPQPQSGQGQENLQGDNGQQEYPALQGNGQGGQGQGNPQGQGSANDLLAGVDLSILNGSIM